MTPVNSLIGWFRKHWDVFMKRPTNGRVAILAIEKQLDDIKVEKRRVINTAGEIAKDASRARAAIEEGHVASSHHS